MKTNNDRKPARRLSLHRDSLREMTILEEQELRMVAAGAGSNSWALGCKNTSCCWVR